MNINEKKHYKMLDIIRVISCILVLLYHLNLVRGGFLAVCTFFTLSGYLSCLSALKKEKFSIKDYYINRIKKLYIPLLVVVAITVILAKVIPGINWLNLKRETISVALGYNNFWQLSANLDYFTRHVNSPFMHLWYISILMQFDLLFPIVFALFKKIGEKTSKAIPTIIVALLTIASTALFYYMSKTQDVMIVYYNTIARSFSLLLGVLIALLYTKREIVKPKILNEFNGLIFFIYSIVFIILSILVSAESSNYAIYMIISSIITARLIRYATIPKRNGRSSGSLDKIVEFISKNSYEIYLVQYPVIFFMQKVTLNNFVKIPLIILITILVSCIIHAILDMKKNKALLKIVKSIIICALIGVSTYFVIVEKDYTSEMKELENILNNNSKITEEKNNQFKNETQVTEPETQTEPEETQSREEIEAMVREKVRNLPVVGVGDSVMLGAADGLYEVFPNGYFDGLVSRSMAGGADVLRELDAEGKLGDVVILALANNSDFFVWRIEELQEILEGKQIYWITAVLADDPEFNDKFEVYAKDYPNIHIVEWEKESRDHPEYFYGDGIHLKGDGIPAYANLIYETIYNDYLQEYLNNNEEK